MGIGHCIFLYNILYKINGFLIAKAKAILLLIKLIIKKKSLYIDTFNGRDLAFNKKYPTSINEITKILGKSKDIKMSDVKLISFESKHTTFSKSRLKIEFISNKFKLIEFNNSKIGQTSKSVD